MSGNTSARVAEVTASARTLPDRIYSSDEPIGSNRSGTCPARRSGSGQPRYGMWIILTPASILNIDMSYSADTGRRHVDLARIGIGIGDQLGNRLCRE